MVKFVMMNEMELFADGIVQLLEAQLHIHAQLNSWMEFMLREKKAVMMETILTQMDAQIPEW